jgi:hypothetical protein
LHRPSPAERSDQRYDACIWRDSKELLDAIHRAILSSFGVPLGDRYQVYEEHSESHFIVQDTGLGIDRTKSAIFIGITSRQRTDRQKTNLYTMLDAESIWRHTQRDANCSRFG